MSGFHLHIKLAPNITWGRHGDDGMVVGFTSTPIQSGPITT